jgi:AraC-like DNA-binding protein
VIRVDEPMLFTSWAHTSQTESFETVIPDGCRDILIVEQEGSRPSVVLTDWDYCARTVRLTPGKKLTGFRLRPGVTVNSRDIHHLEPTADVVKQFVLSEADTNSVACELIEALSEGDRSIPVVARKIGVSARTLQRRFRTQGLPAPEFWCLLSRVRAAAGALSDKTPLADIANTFGFSDQSHMNREFARWFATTPAQMRRNLALISDVSQPGLGNWTFEQISIRNPLGSAT